MHVAFPTTFLIMQTYNSFNELAASQCSSPLVSAMSVFNAEENILVRIDKDGTPVIFYKNSRKDGSETWYEGFTFEEGHFEVKDEGWMRGCRKPKTPEETAAADKLVTQYQNWIQSTPEADTTFRRVDSIKAL